MTLLTVLHTFTFAFLILKTY